MNKEIELIRLERINKFLIESINEAKESLEISKAVDQSDDIMIPLNILTETLDAI